MASWLRNTVCPECGSKDNLGEYDDGSAFCWGCHYYRSPNLVTSFVPKKKKSVYTNVYLPEDATTYLPSYAREWLAQYDLTKEEICAIQPLYSFTKEQLIFPVYDADMKLLMYQGRYFGEKKDYPKYLTYGAKDVLHFLGEDYETITVTEDLISAVKVAFSGAMTTVMPLWGSGIPLELAIRLSRRFKRLVIWLDMDKATESLKMRLKLSTLFETVSCIVTPLDPKEYTHEQIRELVSAS